MQLPKILLYSVFIIALILPRASVYAQSCFTVGTADDETTGTGDWTVGSNWGGTSPGCDINSQDQTVEVDVDMTVQDTNCATLTISGQDAALQVVNNSTLTVEGDFESAGEGVCIYIESGSTLIIEGDFILSGESVDLRVDGSMQVLGDFIISNEFATLDIDGNLDITGELNCSAPCEPGSTTFPGSGTINAGGGCTGDFGAECSNALPIELLSFTASATENGVKINWSTAWEENNHYFTLERSRDPFNFQILTRMDGAGSSHKIRHYSFEDRMALDGVSFYRLKQTDFDGTTETFQVVSIEYFSEEPFIVLGNPASGSKILIFNSLDDDRYQCNVYSISGKLIWESRLMPGTNSLELNHSQNHVLVLLQIINPLGEFVLAERILIN